jgi:hypothetical protein
VGIPTVVLLKQTDVSEDHTASIIRAMMEAVHTSEMSDYFDTISQNIIIFILTAVRTQNLKNQQRFQLGIP